jgi:hypothetical protein
MNSENSGNKTITLGKKFYPYFFSQIFRTGTNKISALKGEEAYEADFRNCKMYSIATGEDEECVKLYLYTKSVSLFWNKEFVENGWGKVFR